MTRWLPLTLVAALSLPACGAGNSDGNGVVNRTAGEAGGAQEGVSEKTIAAGIDQNSRFFQAARAAGLDATLAGPGPYTVFVPDDAAFGKLPPETMQNMARPESRADVTRLLTYHILPGTVLAEDIGKTIENAKGNAVMMTVGGATFTAAREGGKIVLTDNAGNTANITRTDEKFSNGVVHHIDAVLTPGQAEAPAPQG